MALNDTVEADYHAMNSATQPKSPDCHSIAIPSQPKSPGSASAEPPTPPPQIQEPQTPPPQIQEEPPQPQGGPPHFEGEQGVPKVLKTSLLIEQPWKKFCVFLLLYVILIGTLVYPLMILTELRFLQKLDLFLFCLLCFCGTIALNWGYQKKFFEIQTDLGLIPAHLVYTLYVYVGSFILFFIVACLFHFLCSLETNLIQAILASVRSLVYNINLGSICFIHAQRSLLIKAAGIQLQNEISEQVPIDVWDKLKKYQSIIQNYNNYSGNVVSIALLFYFAAAASSCLSLGLYDDGMARIFLVVLIGCPAIIICMTIFFSTVVSKQGKQIIQLLRWNLRDPRLDHCEFESEIGGFAVSTRRFLRILIGLGAFVFTLIPLASWINH